jgi:hypothetical protein
MNNGWERRHTDSDAARRRRHEQQRSWEQVHTTRPDHLSENFAQALGALVDTSFRLPICDRGAKLEAALSRLVNAPDRPAACDAARALLAASELALEEDPWFRFYRAASHAVTTICEAA